MGDAIWNFISSVYEAKWDSLYTDKKSNTLKAKISSKFTPRTVPSNNGNKKEIAKPVPVTINRVPLPPPLPAKTRKEVNCQDHWQWTSFIFIFSLSFSFSFSLIFYFLFLEQLRLGIICHAVTSVTSWWQSHKTDHKTGKNGVKGSGMKWHHITWTTHVGLMSYTWSFRVGCTVVSMDHE